MFGKKSDAHDSKELLSFALQANWKKDVELKISINLHELKIQQEMSIRLIQI